MGSGLSDGDLRVSDAVNGGVTSRVSVMMYESSDLLAESSGPSVVTWGSQDHID